MDEKTLVRLEEFESSKQYYDALQFCRTKVTRCFRLKNPEDQAVPLVKHAFLFFLREKQYQCAIDIAILLAESLEKNSTPMSDAIFGILGEISAKLAKIEEEDEKTVELIISQRRKFVDTSISWTKPQCTDPSEKKFGSSRLHYFFANHYLAENCIEMARNHFLLANRPEEFSNFLTSIWKKGGIESEFDLIIAQAVLQLLCIDRYPAACQLFASYSSKFTNSKTPLMNFIQILLDVIISGDVPQYSTLVEAYMPEILRDTHFKGYLSKIASMYFGVRENKARGGGLAGMLSGLLGGAEQHDDAAISHLTSRKIPVPKAFQRPTVPASKPAEPSKLESKLEVDDLD